ncbi:hypothetical protein GCM10011534_36930 [Pseudooceanicola nanhaiensis]|uniref:Uncharacterized protein n=1 Tax=Pseudooceanicola nanhaiensis TaxID=375761 RepID=A0A917T639_9RHOB|nr:hypothetical protein GCM10011534_36930 [Pseudooceanicola nanhaiensis]
MHLGPAEVQRLGDPGDGGFGNVAERRLQGMQDGQHRPFEMDMRGDDAVDLGGVGGMYWHGGLGRGGWFAPLLRRITR